MSDDIPRRARLDKMIPAERAIYDVMLLVEELGADPILTDVVVLLGDARDRLADFVDAQPEKPGT